MIPRDSAVYRLLASDIDDTLLALDGSLPEKTRIALQSLHRAGIVIVFSSGRATSSLRSVAANIIDPTDDEYLISYNGGRVTTALSDRIIFEQKLSQSIIAEIMQHTRRAGLHVQGYRPQGFIVERHSSTSERRAECYVNDTKMSWDYVDDMAAALPQGSIKLLIIGEHERLLTLQKELADIGRLATFFSKPIYLEVVYSNVNKGRSLSLLAEHLDIPLEQCIAFGDSSNDIEMIQTAGLGVAVANARDDLKAAADLVLERSADEAALVELVRRYFPHVDCPT